MAETKKLLRVVSALALLVGITIAAQAQQGAPQLPPGKWSVAIGPYMNLGYESLPVRVVSVTSQAEGGLKVSKVAVENRSSQALTAVKLAWYLSASETPEIILQQGQTRLLELPPGIQANETRAILFSVVSFAKVYKPLLKDGVLSGSYRIQIAVSEARFDDGSSWTLASVKGKQEKLSL
ncbi:MAG: hypothetical protein ICV60_12170 [Pyrinomonadaceae bacterium]|nr:hypothetical protein [Pyrinomonadaceae bacterium]